MTTSEILSAIYQACDHPSTPEAAVSTRILTSVNLHYRRIMSKPWAQRLRRFSFTVASTSGEPTIAFPFGIARVDRLYEITNDYTLIQKPIGWYRAVDPDPASNTGTPQYWIPLGYSPLFKQPAGTGVWVQSASAADNTQTLTSLVNRADTTPRGLQQAFTTSLNGTTRVLVGNGLYDAITLLELDNVAAGALTFFNAAVGGLTLGELPAGRRFSRHTLFALWPTPSSAITYTVDGEIEIRDLSSTAGGDEPILPIDFHELLVLAGKMDEYEKKNDKRYSVAKTDFEQRIKDLKSWIFNHRNQSYATGGYDDHAPSRLGPYYPAGS